MIFLSVVLAMLLWLVLSITTLSEIQVTLRDVPIDFSLDNSYADLSGLSVMSRDLETVSVSFTGQRDRIGNYSADDLRVSLDLNTVRASGSYDLPLVVTSKNGDQIDNIEIVPKRTVHVEFDHFAFTTFNTNARTLSLDLGNVRAADGHIIDENEIVITPSQITISGPQDIINQVTGCVISFDESMRLSESRTLNSAKVTLYSNDAVFENEQVTLDTTSFSVYVPVYIAKTLPLSVTIQPYTEEIDASSIPYTINPDSLLVRSQNASIDNINELSLGIINLQDIYPGYVKTVNIERNSNYENISGYDTVDVIFDLEGYVERSVTLKNSQIHLVNIPSDYQVIAETNRLNITLVGTEEDLAMIDPSIVVAQVDLLDWQLSVGQQFFVATIYVPGYPRVWCHGTNQILAQVDQVTKSQNEE